MKHDRKRKKGKIEDQGGRPFLGNESVQDEESRGKEGRKELMLWQKKEHACACHAKTDCRFDCLVLGACHYHEIG